MCCSRVDSPAAPARVWEPTEVKLCAPQEICMGRRKGKKKKEKDPHTFFFFSNRNHKWHEVSNKTDPIYRNGKDWATKAEQGLSFLRLQRWPGSCRGIPGEEMLKGRSMGMGGVNQQYKRQLQREAEVKKAAEGQGWSKCQHTEEMVPLQSREQKGHSISF